MWLVFSGLAFVSIVLSVVAYKAHPVLDWTFAQNEYQSRDAQGAPFFTRVFGYDTAQGQAHSPSIILDDEGFSLVWFQGSREAQPDVEIMAAKFRRAGDTWQAGTPQASITSPNLGEVFEPKQLVVTLGNTIENQSQPNAMYATVVSVGGWAMASIAHVQTENGGLVKAHKLNLSPLLNRSNLVKSPKVEYHDGSFALPIYFEMGATHSGLARMNSAGRVVDSRRIPSTGVKAIQPMIVPLDSSNAVAFLRDFDRSNRLSISRTTNGGQSWSKAVKTNIANPSAPVAVVSLGGERLLAAMNDDVDAPDVMRLSVSEDGGASWRLIKALDDAAGAARYPMFRRLASSEIVLTYSHGNKTGISAYIFNDEWVAAL